MVAVTKGRRTARIDLIAGRVSPVFATILSAAPHTKAAAARAGGNHGKRSSALPDVPTVAEAACPGRITLVGQVVTRAQAATGNR